MALCKTLMFLQGVLLSDSSHAFCQQLSLYKKNRPKAICNATAPKTLPQHIPRKLQPVFGGIVSRRYFLCLSTSRANCNCLHYINFILDLNLPQHIPRKLQLIGWICGWIFFHFASAHPAQIATLQSSRSNTRITLCLSTSRANCNLYYDG